MAGSRGLCSQLLIHSADPCHHERRAAFSSHRRRGAGAPSNRLTGFPDLPTPPSPQRQYHDVRQRALGTCVAEITNQETHKKICLGSFHNAKLATHEYGILSVQLHSAMGHWNVEWGETPLLIRLSQGW
ncbi:hypothetical protein D1007_52780 [Hordeum vulgare]|nr:hypothetical protein D1007_52780 [Hordeum vulgare]